MRLDISHVNGAGAMKLLEKLMLEKECGKYNDYKLYIIDDSINKKEDAAYDFAQNLVITYKDLFHIH